MMQICHLFRPKLISAVSIDAMFSLASSFAISNSSKSAFADVLPTLVSA